MNLLVEKQNKSKYYLPASILISVISILTTIYINYQIADRYLRARGKTRALYGLTELLSFGYQYYVVLLGILSFILAAMTINKGEKKNKIISALLLSLLAISIVFARIWRVFI